MESREKKLILVVDDEPEAVFPLVKRLEMEGFDIRTAEDGMTGLTLAREQRPDLIVLDLMLPKLRGYEVCRILKFDPRFARIPIIMLTALSREGDRNAGRDAGADFYVTKPFDGRELVKNIRVLLQVNIVPGTTPTATTRKE